MIFMANIFVEGAGFLVAGALFCYAFLWRKDRNLRLSQSIETQSLLEKARQEAQAIIRDARLLANEETLKLQKQTEESFAVRRQEHFELERRLADREALINAQLEKIVQVEKGFQEQQAGLRHQQAALAAQKEELDKLARSRLEQLQALSRLTESEARAQFLKEIEHEALQDASKLSHHILGEAKARAEEKARQIISVAIQRYAGEHTFETTTATIALQGEEIKGRIIGRDGRNIRAFESVTGVTVLIDDTPNAVVLSGFDPVRREVAREAMTRLILDGRIHPTRIEEVVAKVNQEMDETIVRLGEEAMHKAGLPPMHPEIVKLLGRLHFRHSYSQNVLDHLGRGWRI